MSSPVSLITNPQILSMVYCYADRTVVVTSSNNSADPQTRHDIYDFSRDGQVDFYHQQYSPKDVVVVNPQFTKKASQFGASSRYMTSPEARAAQEAFDRGVRAASVAYRAYEAARKSGKIDSQNMKFEQDGIKYSAAWQNSALLFIYQDERGGYFTFVSGHHCTQPPKSK